MPRVSIFSCTSGASEEHAGTDPRLESNQRAPIRAVVHDRYGPPEVLRLEDVVKAHRYVETQQKTGNVVLTVTGDRAT